MCSLDVKFHGHRIDLVHACSVSSRFFGIEENSSRPGRAEEPNLSVTSVRPALLEAGRWPQHLQLPPVSALVTPAARGCRAACPAFGAAYCGEVLCSLQLPRPPTPRSEWTLQEVVIASGSRKNSLAPSQRRGPITGRNKVRHLGRDSAPARASISVASDIRKLSISAVWDVQFFFFC